MFGFSLGVRREGAWERGGEMLAKGRGLSLVGDR